ncbi:MAG TPA: asparagine--tRNA ligase [archaeon]|nr:asparagine--tRNA ligase [archaeon]
MANKMDEKITIKEILSGRSKERTKIAGWLHHKRSSGGIAFFLVRDGSGIIQCTIKKETLPKIYDEIERLPVESVVELSGEAKAERRAPGGYELQVQEIKILHKAADDYPLASEKKIREHGPEFLLDQRHFYLRSEKMQLVLKIRAKFLQLARRWLEERGYTEFQSPMFTQAAVEGGSTLFSVKYFGGKAYLTQSWQLYAEAAIASLGKIYTVAPSFRAEKSRTRRHITEYWHLEVEEPFCDFECLLKMEEEFVTALLHGLAKEMPEELKKLGRDPEELLKIKTPFKRVTHEEAIKILQKAGVKIKQGEDITWEKEKILTEKEPQPFFLTHFPRGIKAFYHMPDKKRADVTLSVDMLAPEGWGEITGGGQRIDDYDELMKRIKEEKLDPKAYEWYLELRKYGTVPHSGFGLGVERVVAWVCKLEHIRDAIAFPRLINRVYP